MADELARIEREKYERCWGTDGYRRTAPGEVVLEEALGYLLDGLPEDLSCTQLVDFGCGCGRAARELERRGFNVMAVDHAANCLDSDVTVPFVQACLWDLPEGLEGDLGYCTDVMEHIPRERVSDVLEGIHRAISMRVLFQIAHFKNSETKWTGQQDSELHMTVEPAGWWFKMLAKHWPDVLMHPGNKKGRTFFVCAK